MARPRRHSDGDILACVRRDLLEEGAAGFEVTTTARDLRLTSAAIHARLGPKTELVARVWLEPRRRYVEAMEGALQVDDFEQSLARTIQVPFDRWRAEPDAARFALTIPLELLVGHRLAKAKGKRLQERLRTAVDGWRARWAKGAASRDVWYALVNGPAADVLTRGDVETDGYRPLKPLPQHAELARRLRR